ncbi:MAG: hypothetical protein DYH12_20505 [Sorangiineae bacterium PRO1]|nr:hypothetical protein [Sorangiineae bacterium PRO1]
MRSTRASKLRPVPESSPSSRFRSAMMGSTKPVSPEVDAWLERMKTDEGKRAYRARAALCELSNAHLECHHGTAAVLVRGLTKVTCVALLGAIAANVLAHAATWLA